nr:SDR family oxidoreductase [Roseomonas acroporae]
MRGRPAIVCGASRGMGRAIARRLAAEGAAVTMAARNPEGIAAAAAAIAAETGAAVIPVAADLTTEAGRAAVLAACPRPDILVNNGDGMPPGDYRDWDREAWIRALDMMMLAPIGMIRLVADGMMARGFGRIVNLVSRSVKSPQAELGLSNGARSGLVGFVAGLSRQTVARNVTINNVLPGIVDTDAQRAHVEGLVAATGRPFEVIWAERAAANPTGRYGRAEEIADAVAFFCAAGSGFVTGQSLLVDGGQYPGTY